MPSYERVSQDKVDGLVRALIKNRTLIKVAVPDWDYEQLTVITEVKNTGKGACFRIDPPHGLIETIHNGSCEALLFEFSDEDKLPHRFEAVIQEMDGDLWLRYPDHIRRFQLRNDFRIKVPAGAKATIQIDETRMSAIIDNVSLGGVFCHCPNSHKDLISPGLKSGRIDMTFTLGGENRMVAVERAIVRRVEGRTISRHFGMALEFQNIKPDARRRLTRIVYDLQRDYLRNRSRNSV